MINARTFNRRIGVDAPQAGEPSTVSAQMYGTPSSWQPISGGIWASVEPIAGTEAVKGSGVQAGTTYRIRTRYRSDITSRCRVRMPDPTGNSSFVPGATGSTRCRLLSIISVIDEGGARQVLQIMAKDNVNA